MNIEMGARIYNPALGRFLSVDPIEGGTTTNDYGYVPDVVNQFDLTGECGTWGNPFKKCGKGHKGSVGFLGGKFSEAGRWVNEHRALIATVVAGVGCAAAPEACPALQAAASLIRIQQRGLGRWRESVADGVLTYASYGLVSYSSQFAEGALEPVGRIALRIATGTLTDGVAVTACIVSGNSRRGC